MKRLKGIIHNLTTEIIVLACIIMILLVFKVYEMMFKPNSLWITMAMAVLYCSIILLLLIVIVNIIRSLVLDRKRYYLICNRSFFRPRHVWINQFVRFWRPKDKCPREAFDREMIQITNNLPEGTVCYCCTHEDIVKHIKKRFPDAKCTEAYRKDLKKLKKKLKSKRCESCGIKNCPLMESKDTQFYSVKFII